MKVPQIQSGRFFRLKFKVGLKLERRPKTKYQEPQKGFTPSQNSSSGTPNSTGCPLAFEGEIAQTSWSFVCWPMKIEKQARSSFFQLISILPTFGVQWILMLRPVFLGVGLVDSNYLRFQNPRFPDFRTPVAATTTDKLSHPN